MFHPEAMHHQIVSVRGNPILDNINHTEIRPSPIHGLGLFSLKSIPKGQYLVALDGQRVP